MIYAHNDTTSSLPQAGVTSERYEELTKPLRHSAKTLLLGMDAVRGAYEKTLRG